MATVFFTTLWVVYMALSYAQGVIQWLQADTAGVTYTVSGLSFEPKALRFEINGLGSATDLSSETPGFPIRSIGLAVSPSSRRCASTLSGDNQGSAVCKSMVRDDSIVYLIQSGGSVASLDLDAVNSDGFRVIIDTGMALNFSGVTVCWKAWGGSDITNVTVGNFSEPAGTGTQNYTATGFTAAGTDQAVMLAGVQATTINTALAESSTLSIGYATGTAAANNINVVGQSDQGAATMDTDGACYTGECTATIALAGAAVKDSRATLSAFGTDIFTLNWIERAITNRLSIYMAIKGGSWTAGSYTIAGNSASATATVSGLSYAPVGLLLIGRMTAVQAVDVTTVNDCIGYGSGASTSDRHSMGYLDEDGVGTSELNLTLQYDQVLSFPSTTGTLQSAYDINAMNSDGFQIIVDTAGGVASEWQGYLTFGNAPITFVEPPPPTVIQQAVHRAFSY